MWIMRQTGSPVSSCISIAVCIASGQGSKPWTSFVALISVLQSPLAHIRAGITPVPVMGPPIQPLWNNGIHESRFHLNALSRPLHPALPAERNQMINDKCLVNIDNLQRSKTSHMSSLVHRALVTGSRRQILVGVKYSQCFAKNIKISTNHPLRLQRMRLFNTTICG